MSDHIGYFVMSLDFILEYVVNPNGITIRVNGRGEATSLSWEGIVSARDLLNEILLQAPEGTIDAGVAEE